MDTAASGNWSAGATWVGGVPPTSAQTAVILSGHTVTVDNTSAVALSVTVNGGGKITHATGATTKLLVQDGISVSDTGEYECDLSAAPTVVAEILWNNAATGGDVNQPSFSVSAGGRVKLRGHARTRWTTVSGALTGGSSTSATVANAANWRVGDSIVFATTTPGAVVNVATTSGSWSGGYLTLNMASSSSFQKGDTVWLYNVQTNLIGVWTIYDVPGGTSVRIAMADPTVTDAVGNLVRMPRLDIVTLATVDTGTGAITWTDGKGAGGAVAHDHAAGCHVGNLTSNVIIGPAVSGNAARMVVTANATVSNLNAIKNVLFRGFGGNSFRAAALSLSYWSATGTSAAWHADGVSSNVFLDFKNDALNVSDIAESVTRTDNIFLSFVQYSTNAALNRALNVADPGPDTDPVIFAANIGVKFEALGSPVVRPKVYGCGFFAWSSAFGTTSYNLQNGGTAGAFWANHPDAAFQDGGAWSNNWVFGANAGYAIGTSLLTGTDIGAGLGGAYNATVVRVDGGKFRCRLQNCPLQTSGTLINGLNNTDASNYLWLDGKNADPGVQEYYTSQSTTVPFWTRNASTKNRGTASLQAEYVGTGGRVRTWTTTILAKNGVPVRVIGYLRKNAAYTSTTRPKVSITGLGITPVEHTMTNVDDTWEQFDLSATQNSGSDGLLTLTFTVQAAQNGAKAWLDGIPLPPFITRVRHYGFLFDETNPVRTTNVTISAAEATAIAYTGMSVSWGASLSPVTITADQTFQKLYDFTQADACLNVGSALPLTGAGVAGSPSLFAAANLTITTGDKLNGSGSIAMGAYTLSTETASAQAYTYTGGTWSQATTVPTFSGGTLTIGAAGAYTWTQAASMLVVATPTSPSTYDLSGGTFTGTLTVNNAAAHAITVTVPAGTTTSSTGNTGGAITFSSPSIERGIAFTGLQTGTSIQVFTSGTQTKLYGDNSTAGSTFSFDDATAGSITVDYTIQKAGYLPQRVTGVVLTGGIGAQVDVAVVQVVDRAYSTSSGLTYGTTAVVTVGTNPTTNPGTKTFTLSAASTGQNWYSFWIEQWIDLGNATGEALANVEFPLAANGPNSFTLNDGWTFSNGATSIAFLSRDGLRYLNTSDVLQKSWAAILTSGVPSGARVRYQQTDAGTTVNAVVASGNMDELVQIYDVGVFDYRGYLVLKVQEMGYDQAEANVVTLYGNLEDQLYVVGLAPTPNSIATGNPSLATAPTISQGTYTEDGKTFSVKIVDGATPNSGTGIMRWLRYNFETGGSFQSEDAFNWHDLVRQNGDDFKTVNGVVYGTATTKGVLVYQNNGTTLHPDFTLFTADNGTTYAPPPAEVITITGLTAGSRVQLYDTTNSVELVNEIVAGTSKVYSATYTVDRNIRLRVAYATASTAKVFLEVASIGTITTGSPTISYIVAQVTDDVYVTNGIGGETVYNAGEITFTDSSPDVVNIDVVANTVSLKSIYAAWVWYAFTSAGIAVDIDYIDAVDTANYRLSNMVIKNTSSPSVPLEVTGGYAVDAVSGASIDLVDTSGGTLVFAPDHVIPYSVGSGLTAGQDASLSAAAAAAATAATEASTARILLRNKRVLDPATGIETVYDDAGVALYTRAVKVDAAGATAYDGTAAPHRVERYT